MILDLTEEEVERLAELVADTLDEMEENGDVNSDIKAIASCRLLRKFGVDEKSVLYWEEMFNIKGKR